jgi:hypothetical protein
MRAKRLSSSCPNDEVNAGARGYVDAATARPAFRAKALPLILAISLGAAGGAFLSFRDIARAAPGGGAAGLFVRENGLFMQPANKDRYFHDGRFATLADVVDHYNVFFNLNLGGQEKLDLIEYLKSLPEPPSAGDRSR